MGCGSFHSNSEINSRFEKLYKDSYKEIIDFNNVKIGEFNINLIHYDKNIRNTDKIKYYRYFSINIIGSYYAFDDFDMLKLLLSKMKKMPFNTCYIFMMSESESEQILKEFNDFNYILEFIIFFFSYKDYNYLKEKYKKIKLVTNEFSKITEYLKTKHYSEEDLDMDNHLAQTPLITYYDYKNSFYPIHKVLAYFFDFYKSNFSNSYFQKAIQFINESFLESKMKNEIIDIMKKLSECPPSDFPRACIEYYTGENLCYIINKALRNFEKYYVELAHFIGPFYYGLLKYALDNPNKALNKKSTLYRDVMMDRLDLYAYQFCEGDIICFTSFTSTTIKKDLKFKSTSISKKLNNNNNEEKSYVKMIISYNPKGKCVPQGLDVSNESIYSNEKEILLFPFTFLKIDKVEINTGKQNDKHYIYMTIINKGDILEYGLNNNYSFKLIENGTKIIIDKNNDITCNNNESYDIINLDNKSNCENNEISNSKDNEILDKKKKYIRGTLNHNKPKRLNNSYSAKLRIENYIKQSVKNLELYSREIIYKYYK